MLDFVVMKSLDCKLMSLEGPTRQYLGHTSHCGYVRELSSTGIQEKERLSASSALHSLWTSLYLIIVLLSHLSRQMAKRDSF